MSLIVPMVLRGANKNVIILLAVGVVLSTVFAGFAFLASVVIRDKAKAIGIRLEFLNLLLLGLRWLCASFHMELD
jgi:hypothetical protein